MNPEKARELLEEQRVENVDVRRKVRIGGLRGAAAKAAKRINEEHWWSGVRNPAELSGGLLDQLGSHDREAAFTALQPGLGRHLEAMWDAGFGQPYQLGLARKSFRARGAPLVSLPARHIRLVNVLDAIRRYEPDAPWVARWAAWLTADYMADSVGTLLAAVIDGGGSEADEVFEILVASAEGEDEVGRMGRHVSRALLGAAREDGWAFIERMLLAAQRQEGLRQAILETIDEADPQAFRRMLRTIVDHDLVRFPATVRAIDVWFDFRWAAPGGRGLNDILTRVLRFLDEPEVRDAAIRAGTAEDAFLALWSIAYDDGPSAIEPAAALLGDPDPGRRWVAVHLLVQLGLTTALPRIVPALADADLRVTARALDALLLASGRVVDVPPPDAFERLEQLLGRLPTPTVQLEPIVWPWTGRTLDRQAVAGGLVAYLGGRSPEQLVRHLPQMEPGSRRQVAYHLARIKRPSPAVRRALLDLAGDASASVRSLVIEAVKGMRPTDDEVHELEGLLRRKAGDLRRAIVAMLLARGSEAAYLSADRLLSSSDGQQRLAGLEILRRLVESGKSVAPARARATTYLAAAGDGAKLGATERTQLAAILGQVGVGETHDPGAGPREGEATAGRRASAGEPGPTDGAVLEPAAAEPVPASPTIVDGFGLLDPTARTTPVAPRRRDVAFTSDAAFRLLAGLDALVHEHRDTPISIETWSGTEERPIGEVTGGFPAPPGGPRPGMRQVAVVPRDAATVGIDVERGRERLPLHDTWVEWFGRRGPELRDPDGLEILRAHFVPVADPPGARARPTSDADRVVDGVLGAGRAPVPLRYPRVTASLMSWLAVLEPPVGTAAFLLDAAEELLTAIPPGTAVDGDRSDWRNLKLGWRDDASPWLVSLRTARSLRRVRPDAWTVEDHARLWRLERWIDEGGRADLGPAAEAAAVWGAGAARPGEQGILGTLVSRLRKGKVIVASVARPGRRPPPLEETVAAFRTGVATDADVIDQLVGPGSQSVATYRGSFHQLGQLSARGLPAMAAGDERLAAILERIRRRIVAIELRRGEAPTEASRAALALTWSGGLDVLVPLVRSLGAEPFIRGWSYDGESRQVVLSRLIRSTMPGPADSPASFSERMAAARVPERRLVELGCFAPQWAGHVEAAVGWPGLASATWWMHAHTKDPSWVVASEVREAWSAEIAERTPLDGQDLVEGAVDVAWFGRVHGELGDARWKVLDAAAKYGSTGGGHTRAQLFANAMRGATTESAIEARLTAKRHQDSARALGLVPLPGEPGTAERDEAVLHRYRVLQEYIRTTRQFGSARQASEKRAAEIGLANLARTAGYADPIRLGWAMEARGVADMADGPLTVTEGDVELSLAIDERGEPDLAIRRGGATLKAVPPEARKSKEVSALRSRATDLRRQAARIRRSLEGAMVRGDTFSGAELIDLLRHPLLAPQLRRLVLIGDGTVGYPIADGRALLGPEGREAAVGPSEALRLAHPVDLLEGGAEAWHAWQRDAFAREVVQPFKQVFRELYVPTGTELDEDRFSRRYAGHQVQPRQALALLTSRGWVSRPEEGVRRTFHDLRLSAELGFMEGFFSPADVDGLTLEIVRFSRSGGTAEAVPIGEVPARVFSEVMRDLDLVVSVAHAGGVDPEASASTVEMRATLVSETSRLLSLENVRLDGPRAVISGTLSEYSVHLGSAVVHRRPGGALFIVPVHAQARGRLFLPFADDDPKTAEVLAKVLLLARDGEIRDPSILDQIRQG